MMGLMRPLSHHACCASACRACLQLEAQFAGAPLVVVGVHSAKFDNERDRCGPACLWGGWGGWVVAAGVCQCTQLDAVMPVRGVCGCITRAAWGPAPGAP